MQKSRSIIELILGILLVLAFMVGAGRIGYLLLFPNIDETSSMPIRFGTLIEIVIWVIAFVVLIFAYRVAKKSADRSGAISYIAESKKKLGNHPMIAIVIGVVVLIAALFAIMLGLENKLLYHPSDNREAEHYLEQNKNVQRISVEADGQEYCGWMRKSPSGSKKTIVYWGGNAESSALKLASLQSDDRWDIFGDYNFLMVDYPGFGSSPGSPSKDSILRMANAVLEDVLANDSLNEEVLLMGFSLGTGVAVHCAANFDTDGLILLAPYDKMTNVYNSAGFNIFHGPLRNLAANNYESDVLAQSVDEKTLIIASSDDEVIPFKLSKNLEQHFVGDSKFVPIAGVGHNEILFDSKTKQQIYDFILDLE